MLPLLRDRGWNTEFSSVLSVSGPRKRLAEFARTRTALIASILVLLAIAMVLGPVLGTPFYGDDVHNSQRSATLAANDQSAWDHAIQNMRQWMTGQGRFFPVSAIENAFLFDTVHARSLYKILQLGVAASAVGLVGVFTAVLTRNRRLGLLAALLVLPGLQFRYWYDPIHSFAMLLPSLAIKIIGSWLLLVLGLRSKDRRSTAVAFAATGLLWTAALLQYEVTYLLAVVAPVLAWHERRASLARRWTAVAVVLVPTFLLANYVATLRSAANPAPAYTTNWALEDLLPTAVYQLVGPLPAAASAFSGGLPGLGTLLGDLDAWSVLGALAGGVATGLLIHLWGRPTVRSATALSGVGAGLYVLPAVPIAASLRWQVELDWGYAYLPVFLQALGLALFLVGSGSLLASGYERCVHAGLLRPPGRRIGQVACALLGIAVGFSLLVAGLGNRWVADQLTGLRTQQEATDAAISDGFFDLTGEGSTVVASVSAGGNEYVNAAYVTWRGGPADLTVLREIPTTTEPCGQFRICDAEGRALYHFQEVVIDDGSVSFAIARIAGYTSNPEDPLILLDEAAVFGSAERLPACGDDSILVSGHWATSQCDGHPVAASLLGRWLTDATEEELHSGIGRLLEAAVNAGFLDRVEGGATMLVAPGQHFSGALVEWLGGPSGLRFAETLPGDMLPCGEAEFCTVDGRHIFVLRTLGVDDDKILMLAPVAGHTGNPMDPLVVMNYITLFGPGQATPTCVMDDALAGSVPATDEAWVTRLCTGPPSAASSFETWVATGCTEGLAGWFICDGTDSRS